MRTNTDLTPFFRSSVGYDRVFDLLENASRLQPVDNWPPYDIERVGSDAYRISMAVAGFAEDEISLTWKPNLLVVSGSRSGNDNAGYLHRGIATRAFERRFELADFVEVENARLENGLLIVDLKRELPEEMKPRRIEIESAGSGQRIAERRQVEDQKRAA